MALVITLAIVLQGTARAAESEPIVLATSKTGWLVWIADHGNFFRKQGVDVKVKQVVSGVEAAKGLIEGRFQIANMSEFAFATRSFEYPDLRVVGTVAAIDNVRLVGRRDRGITEAKDLVGKKIGLRKGAISEFFLGKLLDLNGIAARDVEILDIRPPDLPNALATGKVDAIVSWEPYADRSGHLVGTERIDMTVQGGQPYYFVLATKQETISSREPSIRKIVAALHEAARWALRNQVLSKQILSERLQVAPEAIERFWMDHVMEVSLTQDMLFLMEEQATWRVETKLSRGRIPNFLDRIYTPALTAVDPASVTIIR